MFEYSLTKQNLVSISHETAHFIIAFVLLISLVKVYYSSSSGTDKEGIS